MNTKSIFSAVVLVGAFAFAGCAHHKGHHHHGKDGVCTEEGKACCDEGKSAEKKAKMEECMKSGKTKEECKASMKKECCGDKETKEMKDKKEKKSPKS